ncbi:beta strand repeat-containing protein [Nostoc sp. UIC 10607]|uniref:beta strand repeat-containing protein n=1 Tax=Nostoc sp. UIC 10607 TaxID=3045935 RepID=UPI0039A08C8F
MVNRNKSVNQQRKLYQSLVATALLTGSLFQFLAPVLADGTTAGTSISNTATATYEDPNSPGTTINATSNTVVVTVAEVAGITVTASGVTDATSSPTNTTVQVGDLLIYTYTLTNVGNDPSKFHIPNQATTTGPGTVSGALPNGGTVNSLQYSTDGGQTWTNVPQGGVDTPSVPVGGTVLVRVPVTVEAGAQTNDIITVTLGNTPGDAQNQLRSPDGGDVFTVDNPDIGITGEVPGAPVNGTREASATEQIKVGLTLKTYALATILKIRSGYNNAGTAAITDDKLTYDLSLRVESNDPTGQGITPAALTGTSINVDGVAGNYILVSDAIPAGTDLAVAPTAPPGWRTVYTINPVATDANTASWTTTAPASLSSVTRVGFINNPAIITSIAPGTTVNGFSIQLAVESTASSPLTIANIAQLFGQTPTNNFPVYDESGDQNPSNYEGSPGSMTPPLGTDPNGDGVPNTLPPDNVDDGYINIPGSPETGTDTGNNNSGTGTGGEANVFTVQAPVASAILNGPQNAPDATGPSGLTNDDFTNKSSLVPAGTAPGSTLDPQSVGFTNTVKNSGTDPGVLKIEPTLPADLPNNTKVTITYGSQSAVYTYNNGAFTTLGTAITIPNFAPGASINYGVEVDLPTGTQLSTDISKGFPVPITASIDNYTTDSNADGIKDTGNDNTFDSFNITIDRVYTGFLKLLKVSRVLQGTGPVVQGNDGTFSTDAKKPAPGNIIEYQIQYTNISEPQSGTGNVILNADKVVIIEDGTQSPNNWALDNDNNTQIDTSNIVGSAKDSGAATIQFFSGNPANSSGIDQTGITVNTDITKYVDTVTGTIAPGIQRTFTFQRKVN